MEIGIFQATAPLMWFLQACRASPAQTEQDPGVFTLKLHRMTL